MAGIIQKQAAAVAEQKGNPTMSDYIKQMQGEIKKALPAMISPERFTRMVLSAISQTPQLGACTPKSFLAAMMNSAQLGLEPNTPLGQAYIIPYKNKGVLEAQYQIGYKGLIDMAYRSGEVASIQAHVVYENDVFECEYGIDPKLKHIPAASNKGEPVKVYACFRTHTGGFGFEVMSMEDVREHAAKYSKAYNSAFSPWKTNFEEMAKKTVLKRCLKYAPMSAEMMRAISTDETVKQTISEDMYIEPAVVIEDDSPEGEIVEEVSAE